MSQIKTKGIIWNFFICVYICWVVDTLFFFVLGQILVHAYADQFFFLVLWRFNRARNDGLILTTARRRTLRRDIESGNVTNVRCRLMYKYFNCYSMINTVCVCALWASLLSYPPTPASMKTATKQPRKNITYFQYLHHVNSNICITSIGISYGNGLARRQL